MSRRQRRQQVGCFYFTENCLCFVWRYFLARAIMALLVLIEQFYFPLKLWIVNWNEVLLEYKSCKTVVNEFVCINTRIGLIGFCLLAYKSIIFFALVVCYWTTSRRVKEKPTQKTNWRRTVSFQVHTYLLTVFIQSWSGHIKTENRCQIRQEKTPQIEMTCPISAHICQNSCSST